MKFRDLYLKPVTVQRFAVATPEWPEYDGKLYMQELSEAEWLQVQESMMDRDPNRRALLVARALVDENGQRVLTDEDAKVLATQPARVAPVARLFGDWYSWHNELIAEQKKS